MGAMLTDIEKGVDIAAAVAEKQHILIQDAARDVAARLRQHRYMADILPAVMKDLPLLQLEDTRIEVIVARQGAGTAWILVEAERNGRIGGER